MIYNMENPVIGLRNTLPAEIDLICELERHQDNKQFIIPYDKNRHLQVIENRDEEHLTVWDKESNQLAGFIILSGLTNPDLSLEFRRIVIQNKGKGLGRKCLQLIKQYCFDTLKFHRLWLDVFEDNERAIYLYKSEGFEEEGRERNVIRDGEVYKSLLILSIFDSSK
jgi:RimJ/RimL family protein N-acetyltransferase